MKSIHNFSLKQKNVLLRVDLNVPVKEGIITDKSRIDSIKLTVQKLLEGNNKLFLISHFRRPKGKYNKKFSLEFLCATLAKELGSKKIYFINNYEPQKIQKIKNKMQFGEIALFENIRFYTEEENNDLNFAKHLSTFFDVYVNDAFSASHRNHASITGITHFLPSLAGISLLNEITNLNKILNDPKKPITAIIGGSKISTKIQLLNNLVEYFDNIIIGGAMANTFIFAKGFDIGKSLCEKKMINNANEILNKAKNYSCNIILPIDVVCADNIEDFNNVRHCMIENILPNQMALDIGNQSIKIMNKILLESNMILWNGPLGAFEYKPFDQGTIAIANTLKTNSNLLNIITIAGGGDTVSAIKLAKAEKSFTFISNAGGAFLEWLEGKESPGVKALKENKNF
tara:strand:+ start:2056 stop:3255 length:1200 start_codon:yes stop_codon:yes gene_type:complete